MENEGAWTGIVDSDRASSVASERRSTIGSALGQDQLHIEKQKPQQSQPGTSTSVRQIINGNASSPKVANDEENMLYSLDKDCGGNAGLQRASHGVQKKPSPRRYQTPTNDLDTEKSDDDDDMFNMGDLSDALPPHKIHPNQAHQKTPVAKANEEIDEDDEMENRMMAERSGRERGARVQTRPRQSNINSTNGPSTNSNGTNGIPPLSSWAPYNDAMLGSSHHRSSSYCSDAGMDGMDEFERAQLHKERLKAGFAGMAEIDAMSVSGNFRQPRLPRRPPSANIIGTRNRDYGSVGTGANNVPIAHPRIAPAAAGARTGGNDGQDFGDNHQRGPPPPPRGGSEHGSTYEGSRRGSRFGGESGSDYARREKYMPPERKDEELYSDRIETGDGFYEYLVDDVRVTCMHNKSQEIHIPLINTFEECGFSKEIMMTLRDLKKYKSPTAVQKAVFPAMLNMTNDLCVNSQTGSGKSSAWMLPIIHEIQQMKRQGITGTVGRTPFAIIILPTKELAEQLYRYAQELIVNTHVSVARAFGAMPSYDTISAIRRGCDLFFTVPGRGHHLLVRDPHLDMKELRWLIFDEADKMVGDNQFYEICKAIMKKVDEDRKDTEYRRLMFSATFENMARVEEFLHDNFIFMEVGGKNRAAVTVHQDFLEVTKYDKPDKLVEILRQGAEVEMLVGKAHYRPIRTIVFANTRRMVERMAHRLTDENFSVISLNGNRPLRVRFHAIDKFKNNVFQVLVTTDVAARGLNIPKVSQVINFDMPLFEETAYIHRIGRTGRIGNTGWAISFFDPNSDLKLVKFIERTLTNGDENGPGRQKVPHFLQELIYGQDEEIVDLRDRINAPSSSAAHNLQQSMTPLQQPNPGREGFYRHGNYLFYNKTASEETGSIDHDERDAESTTESTGLP